MSSDKIDKAVDRLLGEDFAAAKSSSQRKWYVIKDDDETNVTVRKVVFADTPLHAAVAYYAGKKSWSSDLEPYVKKFNGFHFIQDEDSEGCAWHEQEGYVATGTWAVATTKQKAQELFDNNGGGTTVDEWD